MDDTDEHVMEEGALEWKNLADLRVHELRRELERRGLRLDGGKDELVGRLQAALNAEDGACDAAVGDGGAGSEYVWEVVPGSDRGAPYARAGHGMVAFCNRLYLFGGFSDYGGRSDLMRTPVQHYNSVHEYSLDLRAWRELHAGASDTHAVTTPVPRRHASLVVHGCSLYVYGGFDANDSVLGDLWEFNIETSTWSRVFPENSQDVPGGRAEHTAVVYLNRMYVFGGYDGKRKLNDTYVFDFATKSWSAPLRARHNAPSRRCKHSAVLHDNHMYVLGGFQYNNGDNYALTDLHALNLHTLVWMPVLMNDGCPRALQGHKAVVSENAMLVVGGKVRTTSNMLVSGETRSTGLNQSVFCYDFDTYRWSVLSVSGASPAPRQLHTAVVVPRCGNQDSVFLFGGTDKPKQSYYDELWELRPRETMKETACAGCSSTARLLNSEQFSDVHFVVEGKTIYAHRAILYSRSDYFRTMFDAQMRESSSLRVPIQGVSYEVFMSVMEYLYTRKVHVHDESHAVDLLKAADMFRLDGLRTYCVIKVEQAVTVDNVCDMLRIADSHIVDSLKQYCLNFIIHNFKRVIDTHSFLRLMKDDADGLGRQVLSAVADAYPNVSLTNKRARI